jgi:hypothetical protein
MSFRELGAARQRRIKGVLNKITFVLIGLSLLATTAPVFGQGVSNQQIELSNTEHLSLSPVGTIYIKDSYGDLNVDGWEKPEVEVTVVKRLPFGFKPGQSDEATKRLEQVQTIAQRTSNSDVVISTRSSGRNVTLEYEIHVPRDSKLIIHHGKGSVLVNGVIGNIEATCSQGDIVLILDDSVPATIDARSKFGVVTSDLEGSLRVARYGLGERYSAGSPATQQIVLRGGFGGIAIKKLPPEPTPSKNTR